MHQSDILILFSSQAAKTCPILRAKSSSSKPHHNFSQIFKFSVSCRNGFFSPLGKEGVHHSLKQLQFQDSISGHQNPVVSHFLLVPFPLSARPGRFRFHRRPCFFCRRLLEDVSSVVFGSKVTPLRIGLFCFQMTFSWLMNGGDPNHLLSGVILQA